MAKPAQSLFPFPARRSSRSRPRRQRGIAALEYTMILAIGVIPLLYFTFTGIMLFTIKQSMELAATEGARAALQYGSPADRQNSACIAATTSMAWLITYMNDRKAVANVCGSSQGSVVQVTGPAACPGGNSGSGTSSGDTPTPAPQCVTVTIAYDYATYPFLPAPKLFSDVIGDIVSTATVQLAPDDIPAPPTSGH